MVKDTFSSLVDNIFATHPEYVESGQARELTDEEQEVLEPKMANGYSQQTKVAKVNIQANGYNVGAQALMNEHAIIVVGNDGKNYKDYKNTKPSLWFDEAISPTAKNLTTIWNEKNPFAPYKMEDFLYAKHYGLIPNNRLITLRRYYKPIYDNLQVAVDEKEPDYETGNRNELVKNNYPIATAVTWFGNETSNEIDSILNFSTGINWGKLTADVHTRERGNVEYEGESKKLKNIFNKIAFATGDATLTSAGGGFNTLGFDPYKDGPYMNKVYGPINVIMETLKRERGLTFDMNLAIKFSYSLRSIESNNPKVVMLDILSNLLSLTFNFAQFWGGAYRYNPGSINKSPIPGGIGLLKAVHTQDIDGIIRQLQTSVKNMGNDIMSLAKSLTSGGSVEDIINNILGYTQKTGFLNQMLKSVGMGDLSSILAYPPLLTGEPIGEWHLAVGNPFNPLLMVGNLVVEKANFSFGKEFTIEGFPTELNVEINLRHGRPRDAGDIQSMFNRGNGRIYHYKDEKLNQSSSTRNTGNDTGQKGSSTALKNTYAKKFYFDSIEGKKLRE